MFLKRILEIRHTLAFRLALWYATIFAVSSLIAFYIFYIVISSTIQRQTEHELLNDIREFSSILKLKGSDSLKAEMEIEAESDGVHKVFFRFLGAEGEEIASSNMSFWREVGISRTALNRIAEGEKCVFETLALQGEPYKVCIAYGVIGPDKIMQIGQSLEDDARFLEVFRKIFGTSIMVIMSFSALIGWFMGKRALSNIDEVTRTALDISKGAFDQRVRIRAKGDEIERLATAFNRMLNRLQELVTRMKEVTDNIAHDLKTPITRIRGLAESKLNAGNPSDDGHILAADIIEECDYLLQMINTLLEISETEAGAGKLIKKQVDMAPIIQDAHELFRPIAEEKGLTLISQVPDHMYIQGEIQGLKRIMVNLLENAIKYTPPGGMVTTSVETYTGGIVISIQDTGIGISKEDLPHIFERLYRCDTSRSEPGFGLGLSLALAVARAHGGDITVTSHPGKGSTFQVTLIR